MQTDTLTQEQFLEAIRLQAQPTWADLAGLVVKACCRNEA